MVLCLSCFSPAFINYNNVAVAVAASPKLNSKSIALYKGQYYVLKLRNAKGKISWSSKDKSIATVSKSGKVTAKKNGTTIITAKSNRKSYKCKVTVKTYNLYNTKSKHVVNNLKKCGFKLTKITNYSKKNDPNKGDNTSTINYKSKSDFYDIRYLEEGEDDYCTVEVFGNDRDAEKRYSYLNYIYSIFPYFKMRTYRVDNVVLRLTPSMSKAQANKYYKALKKMAQ